MTLHFQPLRATLIGVALTACGGPEPPAPVVQLPAATDSVDSPYAEVPDGVWLGAGRWAVVAPLDVVVGVVEPAAGTVMPLGGAAAGKELRNPSTIFRAGDSLYVGDWGVRRTTLWTPEGRLVRAIPALDAARGALPRGRDAQGRYYYELMPPPGPDGSGNRDSAAVIRAGPGGQDVDTIARLAPLDVAEVMGDAGRRFERRVFSGNDRWGVLSDGSLWVARVYENRVDWRDPDGDWTRGEALPDRVLEVTRYDREVFLRRFPPELRATAEQLPFAPVKPPFEAGFTASSGEVWLEKSRAPADSTRRYHVVDREGQLLRDIRVPGAGRIVALGADAALVAERMTEGTRFRRFPIPPGPADKMSLSARDGSALPSR
ncbi:MAG: hypothetical protein M3477_08760 [Gemmatimonadota bacterium]|nr:hypothetical protein [Gemmatimonadota bacterium]